MDRNAGYELYGVSVLPDTYLISAAGLLQLRFAGSRQWRTQELRTVLSAEEDKP
jgi:hypothetical protein